MNLNRSYHFELKLISVYVPLLWAASLILTVGSHGELGCIFSNGCDHPWSSDRRVLFFAFFFGPPLAIWGLRALIAWLLRNFGSPN